MNTIFMTRKIITKPLLITVLFLGGINTGLAAVCTPGITRTGLSECNATTLASDIIKNDSECKKLLLDPSSYTINLGVFGMCKVTKSPQVQGKGSSGGDGSQ